MTVLPRFMISATHKSSGKTLVSTGITAALAKRGHKVSVFKKGPDYIDPMWLQLAAGRPAYNLDFNTMSHRELESLFALKAENADISLIEANKGLYDGVAIDGSNSNAALAKLLGTPVVLVVDTKGMSRGIAPLLQGYVGFDTSVCIAGVIFNRTGGSRHETKLRSAVETYTDLPVYGAISDLAELDINERHLGLTTPREVSQLRALIDGVARVIAQSVNLEEVLQIAKNTPDIPFPLQGRQVPTTNCRLRIGIARDDAFSFYYADDLEAFSASGAEMVPIDMIRDKQLPEIDGLFIGGGFPETHAAALASNTTLQTSIKNALEAGLPAYAECGGLMYLCHSLTWQGKKHRMVGFFEADAVLHNRPQGRGYVSFQSTANALWPLHSNESHAHEFHYASIENLVQPTWGRDIIRGYGIDGTHDALIKANTQAGFFHLRHCTQTPWVTDFLDFIGSIKSETTCATVHHRVRQHKVV